MVIFRKGLIGCNLINRTLSEELPFLEISVITFSVRWLIIDSWLTTSALPYN